MKKLAICFVLLLTICSFCVGCNNKENVSSIIEVEEEAIEDTSQINQEKVKIQDKNALNQGYMVTSVNSDNKELEMKFDEIMKQTKSK